MTRSVDGDVKRTTPEIIAALDESAKHMYRRGPIHGDLNADNIRVRNGEAILIDFYKSAIGPLVADIAALEIALVFGLEERTVWDVSKDGTYAESERFKEWACQIEILFSGFKEGFCRVPPANSGVPSYEWMWSVCRQLRLMAHYIENDDLAYGHVLVAYLLRLCMFPDCETELLTGSPEVVVRAFAYWTAEKILNTIVEGQRVS
jgi:hypothetical protein